MEVEQIGLDELRSDETNARRHGIRNLDAIAQSLKRFGQQKPIVIDAQNFVKAGNGTLEAARKLGWDSVSCVRSELDGAELAAFAVADNRTSELAEWDMEELAEQLQQFTEYDPDLVLAAGFNDGEMTALFTVDDDGDEGNDPGSEWDGMPEFQQANLSFRAIVVHFTCAEDVVRFAELVGQDISEKAKFIWYPEVERAETHRQRVAAVGGENAEVS